MTVKQIEKHVLKLDTRSRARLAKRLLHSLEELSDTENEQLWAEEALRRHQEMAKGKAKSRRAEDVFRSARILAISSQKRHPLYWKGRT